MSTPIQCPACGKRYKVGDDLAGKRVRCGCGAALIVPALQPPGSDNDGLDESLYDAIAAGGPAPNREAAADEIPDDLLDETIWDAEPKSEAPDEPMKVEADEDTPAVAEPLHAAPVAEEKRPRPTETDKDEDEYTPDTFWDRVKSPSRELIAWLSIGYGVWMLVLAQILMAMLFVSCPLVMIFLLAPLTIAGGVLILKRHPLGPSFAGLGSAGIAFFVLFTTLLSRLPIHVFMMVFAVEYVPFFFAPTYIIYWCLKEDEVIAEEAKRDEFYAVRDKIVDRMIKENQEEWKSQQEARESSGP